MEDQVNPRRVRDGLCPVLGGDKFVQALPHAERRACDASISFMNFGDTSSSVPNSSKTCASGSSESSWPSQ
jgi:hypothetical protein